MATARTRLGGWWARWPAAGLLIPLLLAAAAYARVLPGQFQFDDEHAIVGNPAVKDLGAYLGAAPWRAALHGGRPVTDLTFALNYAFAGLEPWNFHLTNLCIHLAAVILAWAVARRLLRLAGAARAEGVALAAAGLFALHPLQSQAVSYLVQRAESLSAALALASLLLLLAAEERPAGPVRLARFAGALLLFAAALGAKASAAFLPAGWLVLLALVPSPEARGRLMPWRARALHAVPFLGLLAVFAWSTLGSLSGPEIGLAVEGLPPATYLRTQAPVVATYLRLLLWPAGQSVDWHLTPARLLAGPWAALAALLLLALAAGALLLALRARRRDGEGAAAARVAWAGLLWFFLALAPSSSVVPVIDLLVEHRVYLAALGIFLAAAVAAERALARWAPRPAWLPAAALAACWLLLAGLLHARNAVWETRRALWSDAAAKGPENPRAWVNLALAASQEGRGDEAIRLAERALPLAEGEPAVLVRLLGNLGIEQARAGRLAEAEATLRRAVALQPWATLRNDLAAVLTVRGRLDEAEALLGEVLADDPSSGEALTSLGKLRLMRGDPAGALPLLERAVALDPDVPLRRVLQARALSGLSRREEACAALRRLPQALDRSLAADVARAWRDLGCGR